MLFWKKKINSDEYEKLLIMIKEIEIEVKKIALEVQLYTKKLKVSKGIEKEDKNLNSIILPE